MKFKIGDKIKCIDAPNWFMIVQGNEYYVVDICCDCFDGSEIMTISINPDLKLVISRHNCHQWYSVDRFELVENENVEWML